MSVDDSTRRETTNGPRRGSETTRTRVQALVGSDLARAAWWAAAAYVLVRAVSLAILWVWARDQHRSTLTLLGDSWDATWYTGIASHGYDHGQGLSNLAFLPLFPASIHVVTSVTALSAAAAGVAVAGLSGVVAALGLGRLGARLATARTGVVLAVLWGVLPHAVTESMAYTESLFTACAVWAIIGTLERRWVLAGTACFLAGLTRPTATAVIPVVVLAALLALVRTRGRSPSAWFALVVSPAGWVGYLLWVGQRVGHLDGWFRIQDRAWKSGWDGGSFTVTRLQAVLSKPSYLDLYVVALVLVVAVALFAITVVDRQPWPLLGYSLITLLIAWGGSGFFHAKARFLVGAFPLLVPPARALADARPATRWIVLALLTLTSAYFGGYLLLQWRASP